MEDAKKTLDYWQEKVWEMNLLTGIGMQSEHRMENAIFKKLHEELGYLSDSIRRESTKVTE